ncbi:MAG: Transglutaminase domain protein [Betaproteobacteria bacterium]|nr:Transglutaminase domain protein [Betaproteobacteria bacterium]
MNSALIDPPPLELTVRVGCKLVYETTARAPLLLVLKPRLDVRQLILEEKLVFGAGVPTEQLEDTHGNVVYRLMLMSGRTEIVHDAIFAVPRALDNFGLADDVVPIEHMPIEVLRYTMPSRYCDSDKLMSFALEKFAHIPRGVEQVRAITDWTHRNIEYRYGSGSAVISAWDVVERGFGVCRDLAHVVVALCRALSYASRYVSGHVPDIGVFDPGIPMDFHAYAEVYLGGHWHTFDARYNRPRIGRVKIAHGLDAVDGAFSTLYGVATLASFDVWAYQVEHSRVRVGDPIDLTKRLDGTEQLRSSAYP